MTFRPKVDKYYRKDGSIESEHYYLNDKRHREDGPATINYRKDGSISSEQYWLNGKCHRQDGPAFVYYREDGSIYSEYYWLNGEQATKEQIQEIKFNKAFDKEVLEVLSK